MTDTLDIPLFLSARCCLSSLAIGKLLHIRFPMQASLLPLQGYASPSKVSQVNAVVSMFMPNQELCRNKALYKAD